MKIFGAFLVFFGLFCIFHEHQLIMGIVTIAVGLFCFLKRKKTEPPVVEERPSPRYTFKYVKLFDQDASFNQRYRSQHKDEFIEDDDYSLPKNELIETFMNTKVYRYMEDIIECSMDGRKVMLDGEMVGKVASEDMPIVESGHPQLVFYPNEYKDVSLDDYETIKDEPYFMLRITQIKKDGN